MPLLLAPYNNAMRLGMGFNSYTQTMCIDSAVEATDEAMITSETLSPKITISSMLFESVSEVADTMDISHAATMTTGKMEVHGHMNALNSAEIDDADISLMVSVRVMSEITSLKGSARFLPIDGMEAGSPRFNETFGDSYISGFITGGLFISIISFIASDSDRKDKLIEAVKKGLTEPTMALENVCKEFAITSVIQGVEVEDMNRAADVASILRIAGEFPALVAQDPQRTWAILTKYKANRSFNQWSSYQMLKPLDYDGVASYTSKLFDNYMQYNHLSKKVQDIISQRDKYSQVDKPRAIPPELNTLLATQSALDKEINKIVAVVNTLTRHPELLPKIDFLNANLKDDLVQEIVNEALHLAISEEDSPVRHHGSLPYEAEYSPSETSGGFEDISTPQSSDMDSASLRGRPALDLNRAHSFDDLKLHLLIPPGVWADLLPERTETGNKTDTVNTINTEKTERSQREELQIIAAVCGIRDVTAKLQQLVLDRPRVHELNLFVNKISELEDRDAYGSFTPRNTTNLSIVYKYTDGPTRVCSVDHDQCSTKILKITPKSKHQTAEGVTYSMSGLTLLSVVYGGKVYQKTCDLDRFMKKADHENPGLWPRIQFNKQTVGDDYSGIGDVTGVVFYEYSNSPGIQSAVSLGDTGCLLTNQRQLANLTST
ncbi:hypothetical protein FAGAP_1205 [Fusarium agapanthi]|uniref:Uncharacterized protein n=1 Tax=Fusarium agapanthi TaxID=1803897 RepID=A0A9P5BJZ7_9HYPO|nr:hypothetical protein FAGAP_1205 [Fusarium agapanthi]